MHFLHKLRCHICRKQPPPLTLCEQFQSFIPGTALALEATEPNSPQNAVGEKNAWMAECIRIINAVQSLDDVAGRRRNNTGHHG
jgi:hypothetical protein